MKNGDGLTLEELGRNLLEATVTEEVVRGRVTALLPLARREERALNVLGKDSRLTVEPAAGDVVVTRGLSGAFEVSLPHTLTVRVETGEVTAAHELGATIVLRITPTPRAPLAIFLDVTEPVPESVSLAEAPALANDYLRGRIAEEIRKELLRLTRARIAETVAERTLDLEALLGRALAAGPGAHDAPPPSRVRGAGARPAAPGRPQGDRAREMDAQLRFFGDAMSLQVWTALPDGTLSFVNRAALDYFDRTEEQMAGDGWLSVLHPDDVHKAIEEWPRCLETGQPYEVEVRLRCAADQSYREHVVRALPQRDPAGNVTRWLGHNIDVSYMRRTEAALRRSEARYRLFAEASNEGVWFWDLREDTIEWSDRMLEMMGVRREAWGGTFMDFFERLHPDDRSAIQDGLRAHLEERRPFDVEVRLRHGGGEYRTMRTRGKAEWDEKGVPFRMAGGALDITEQKRHQAMLKERLEIIEQQQEAIRALSTPIIEVWKGVLTMPVLGVLDAQRSRQMMEVLLEAVARTRCRHAIIDLTGVSALDTTTADHVLKLIDAVALLGAQGIVVGIRPEVAQTVVSLGLDLSHIKTLSNLREALLFAMQSSGVSVRRRRRGAGRGRGGADDAGRDLAR
ncbi:anti-anti sigma factor protein [Sorangium cellulosum]|uniref:Anti-anti sigma factor protein n=1 Tax=Sorangium cellulosum TaxID=56 RepID=A0A4P2Q7Z4_SORCE|nr:PAS domain-containing protein [Sorangium cellulosum]AUX25610.1 anti-anti sigma factor protein [Sorangium cellulosum]